jgi:hypothetical protein
MEGKGSLRGRTRNVRIFGNVVHGIRTGTHQAALKLLANGGGGLQNVRIYNNQFQSPIYPNTLAIVEDLRGLRFESNTWFSASPGKPFRLGGKKNPRELNFEEWVAASGEVGAKYEKINYPDSDRSIENYMRKLGYQGTDVDLYANFFVAVRTMRRGAWRPEFTARNINDYFRAGFGMKALPLNDLPPVPCGPYKPEFSYRQ